MTHTTTRAASRPFRHRLFTSPMRDLVRRRASGRLDLTIYPERAALPTVLGDLVVRIAKRTRLRALEKADVARELSAHFAEGVAAGKTTDELIDRFGDLKKAVRLIRRAKKRNRSRILRAARRAMVGAFTVLAILYSGMLLWYVFGIGKVNPSHDYLADMNAAALAVPEKDRAWPVYRQAFLQLGQIPGDVYRCTGPADYRWPQAVAYIEAHQAELEQFRRAAALPGLGYIVALRYNKADLPLFDPDGTKTDRMLAEDSPDMTPMLAGMLTPYLGYLSRAANLLWFEALHQLEIGSATGVLADIQAMVGLARQMGEQETLISQLVRIEINTLAEHTAARLLARAGQSLTNENLAALDNLFNPAMVGDLSAISMKSERYILDDFEQHIYTDNGHGNGRLHSNMLLMGLSDGSPIFSMPLLLAPPVSALMPDRKTFHAQGEQIYDTAERELAKPMWERDPSELQILLDRIQSSLWEQNRWIFLLMLIRPFDHIISVGDIAAMQRDATRTTIALFRYKNVEHRWPTDLSALVPVYLDTLPIDRFDGKPIRYKLDTTGEPILYSVGSDLDDDGGAPALDKDDWPTLEGADRWIPPSRMAELKAKAGPPQGARWAWPSRWLADGDFIFYPPLPDKPVIPEPDDGDFS